MYNTALGFSYDRLWPKKE